MGTETMQDSTPTCYIGEDVLQVGSVDVLFADYTNLLKRLHRGRNDIDERVTKERFLSLLRLQSEILVFLVSCDHILATAQATLSAVYPTWNSVVGNVVACSGHEGKGYGRTVMNALEDAVKNKWPEVCYLALTNNPNKKNGDFYRKLGYRPRSDDRLLVVWLKRFLDWNGQTTDTETVVWVKMI